MHGFDDPANNMMFNDVDIYRQDNEDEGNALVLGLPFFHLNSVLYDLENRTTGFSPFFVSADDFTTSTPAAGEMQLQRITGDSGSQGWLGLAGIVSGEGSF